jgi:hypothetical protein
MVDVLLAPCRIDRVAGVTVSVKLGGEVIVTETAPTIVE